MSGITLKMRLRCKWYALLRLWYRLRHGIQFGWGGSMLPNLGRGKYVDVIRRGDFIDIRDHHDEKNPFTIRLIPFQPNHGVMVEYSDMNGNGRWRILMDSRNFLEYVTGKREALPADPKRKPYPKTKCTLETDTTCCGSFDAAAVAQKSAREIVAMRQEGISRAQGKTAVFKELYGKHD